MKLSDTLTGEKRDFHPSGDEVRIYVCGVTPYSSAHVGHAMSYIVFDVLHRYLEFRGFKVRRVQNFTDIDDKLIDRAAQENTTVEALAERHIAEYFANMAALNIREADEYPRATQEVPKIVEVISGLIDSRHAYESNGDVYFRVRSDDQYGKLSHRSLDAMRAGARIEPGVQKEHPMDFALWKSAKPGEPSWESPWGGGRPGWHIECSAMALRYLGESIDIHGGGQDLVFPHHENEIAQSEAFTGIRPFARFWLHNGLLNLDAQKMSKSLGNLVTIDEALEEYSADAIRLSVLNAHYRSPGYYSDEALAGSERAAERLREAASAEPNAGAGDALDASETQARFIEAMDDDLNSPQAVATLFDLAREINRGSTGGQDVASAQETLRELTGVLGLTLEERKDTVDAGLAARIERLENRRAALRSARDFEGADAIRTELMALGVELSDTQSARNQNGDNGYEDWGDDTYGRNRLYFGDNLKILRERIQDDSVDLIYVDPPQLLSNHSWPSLDLTDTMLARSTRVFNDILHWDSEEPFARQDIARFIEAMKVVHNLRDVHYLTGTAKRIIELHRVLRPKGSIYLHCNSDASHYFRLLMDVVFGKDNFRSEIIWNNAHSSARLQEKRYSAAHDVIFFYTKGREWTWNPVYTYYYRLYGKKRYPNGEFDEKSNKTRHYRTTSLMRPKRMSGYSYSWDVKRPMDGEWTADLGGGIENPISGWEYKRIVLDKHHWRVSYEDMVKFTHDNRLAYSEDGVPTYKTYLEEMPGVPLRDVWTDIPALGIHSREGAGYPTQKPAALLERIITVSSNKGDVVLDPFCGSGTTIVASEHLGRKWIGMEASHFAMTMIGNRLVKTFEEPVPYDVVNENGIRS